MQGDYKESQKDSIIASRYGFRNRLPNQSESERRMTSDLASFPASSFWHYAKTGRKKVKGGVAQMSHIVTSVVE